MNGKVCAKCRIEMYPKENGVWVLEYAGFGPYKLWKADLWACKGCSAEIVVGFSQGPFAEHFESGFKGIIENINKSGTKLIECYERLSEVTDDRAESS